MHQCISSESREKYYAPWHQLSPYQNFKLLLTCIISQNIHDIPKTIIPKDTKIVTLVHFEITILLKIHFSDSAQCVINMVQSRNVCICYSYNSTIIDTKHRVTKIVIMCHYASWSIVSYFQEEYWMDNIIFVPFQLYKFILNGMVILS